MPTVFSLPSFLRRAPNTLLKDFFASYPTFTDFNWDTVSERRVDPVLERFMQLPAAERERVLRIFRRVEALADSEGSQVLIEAARDINEEIAATLATMGSSRERALWTFMNHPRVFENARTLAHIDVLPKRSWETRKVQAVPSFQATDDMNVELGLRIAEFYQAIQGRGERCAVDHWSRDGGVEYFFAYPADYADELIGYDDEGQFERKNYHPAFQIVFAYHPADGTLDIFAQGGGMIRDHLARAFCCTVLGVEQELERWPAPCFDLELFKNRNLTFPTRPEDHISLVRVKALRVQYHTGNGGKVTFEIDGRRRIGSVHDVIADRLSEEHTLLADATVLSVVLQAFIRTSTGRDRSLTFRLTAPSFCDLEDTPEELALRRYLHEWGIEKDAVSLEDAAVTADVN
ncbi:MAG: hypothetical protein P4K98_09895 [Bryobacteraceae bacterium]|nr:hypothetical protein [Bryobacteraceae bacterium]